jgi:hypothetical protein
MFPAAWLSNGAEEDLGVPTKRNPARAVLARKPNPVTYGQMAISPYVIRSQIQMDSFSDGSKVDLDDEILMT